jgi:C1A family cysteine protease
MINNFGWLRDIPDKRDFIYGANYKKLPKEVDLSKQMPYPYNQGRLGSCTAQAMAAIYQFTFKENRKRNFLPSRLKIYYDERRLEGTVRFDFGATLRSGMKVLSKIGVCKEKFWTYSDNNRKFKRRPPKKCYKISKQHKALRYYKVNQTINDLCLAIASEDPVAFGFATYSSLYKKKVAKTGIIPMPKFKSEKFLGGHAVVLVGYNIKTQMFKIRNSWGVWGDKGYGYLPFEYVSDSSLAADFWALKKVK